MYKAFLLNTFKPSLFLNNSRIASAILTSFSLGNRSNNVYKSKCHWDKMACRCTETDKPREKILVIKGFHLSALRPQPCGYSALHSVWSINHLLAHPSHPLFGSHWSQGTKLPQPELPRPKISNIVSTFYKFGFSYSPALPMLRYFSVKLSIFLVASGLFVAWHNSRDTDFS